MLHEQNEHEKGTVIVLVALLMTVFLGMSALVVDVFMLYMKQAQLQNAIDASALAAAQELPNTESALTVANQYIGLNGFSPTDVNITFSDGDYTINITGNKTVNFLFAKVLGFNSGIVRASGEYYGRNRPLARLG